MVKESHRQDGKGRRGSGSAGCDPAVQSTAVLPWDCTLGHRKSASVAMHVRVCPSVMICWWFSPQSKQIQLFFFSLSDFLASLFSPECENSCILDVLTCIVMIFSQCLWINDIPQVCLCFHSITNHLQERLCWLKQQSSGGSRVLLMHWIYWITMVLWVQKAQAPPVIQVPILKMGPVCSHWGLHPDQAFGYTQIRSNQKA